MGVAVKRTSRPGDLWLEFLREYKCLAGVTSRPSCATRVPVKLSDLAVGQVLAGVIPTAKVTVAALTPMGASVNIIYTTADGQVGQRLLTSQEIEAVSIALTGTPWRFDGDASAFKLAIEAKRISLAHLFDPMMAVHASNVQALPHQITAVYESLLPRQPLRFVLADDPGAGKTVMAGLYIRELLMRADARRVLVVAPGSLVLQWQEELGTKFGLRFTIYSRELPGNPFEDYELVIARLDQLSRDESLADRAKAVNWDLIIFDEAHKLAAHAGTDGVIEGTGRFRLAQALGAVTRHLLLMTATPHNGVEEDFQAFLSLLDHDRFRGRYRRDAHGRTDAGDLMRRMVKEELIKFDGTPLFPERRAYTANYALSAKENELYEAVTTYVRDEMGRSENLDGQRRGAVGFALTLLQRRLASSPEAIYQSLRRRRERLRARLAELKNGKQPDDTVFALLPADDDELDSEEQERVEEELLDEASAARTETELEAETLQLQALEVRAQHLVASNQDRKWDELSKILQHHEELRGPDGKLRKLIVFTEHRDTLNYLVKRIGGVLGGQQSIVTIHGGTPRLERLEAQAKFRNEKDVRVLIATDAAGEGVNLQVANLMVNYDLPWNPNRLEQRFGRIHRIGQTEVCHLWNLVAAQTREGAVFHRLLEKLRIESEALKGRVFDILGQAFEERPLRDMLIEAIRYGEREDVKARLTQQVEHAFDREHLKRILDRNALAQETLTPERLFAVKEEMEQAEARRLQPFFVEAFFKEAFLSLGGAMHSREKGRYEITHVPGVLRDRGRILAARKSHLPSPVLSRYERVCFEPALVRPVDKPNWVQAELLHPGHPLVMAVTGLVLEKHADLLKQGAVFIDDTDEGLAPHLLFLLTHEIKDGQGSSVSQRLQFVRVRADGQSMAAGWAPHLVLTPATDADRALLADVLAAPWLTAGLEQKAMGLAASTLAPEHFSEVSARRKEQVKKTRRAVHERLTAEIDFLAERLQKYRRDREAGKNVLTATVEKARRDHDEMVQRLDARSAELKAQESMHQSPPVVAGGAIVVPVGLLRQLRGEQADALSQDPAARARIERLAMSAVRAAEEARGCVVTDVSAAKCGWDLTSRPPARDGVELPQRHLEVKGRIKGATTISVTRNELMGALNQPDKFALAIVLVNEDDSTEGPFYVRGWLKDAPDWSVAAIDYKLSELLKKAQKE